MRDTAWPSASCILLFTCSAMYNQTAPWRHTVAIITRTAREFLLLVIVALWLAFVDSKLYGEKSRNILCSTSGYSCRLRRRSPC